MNCGVRARDLVSNVYMIPMENFLQIHLEPELLIARAHLVRLVITGLLMFYLIVVHWS